jgi:hypothetical protein
MFATVTIYLASVKLSQIRRNRGELWKALNYSELA